MQIFQPGSSLQGLGFGLQAVCLAFQGAGLLPASGKVLDAFMAALASLASSRASAFRAFLFSPVDVLCIVVSSMTFYLKLSIMS